MKCPECGQWNRASMPHCVRCGSPLNIDESSRVQWKDTLEKSPASTAYLRADEFGQFDETPDSRETLAREMQDLKERKQRGAELKEQLLSAGHYSRSGSAAADSSAAGENGSGCFASDPVLRREAEARHRVRFMDQSGAFIESRSYDPLIPDYPAFSSHRTGFYSEAPFSRQNEKKGKLLRILLLAVLIAAVGCGGYLLLKNFVFPDRVVSGNSGAIVTTSVIDDLSAHTILIPGEEGSTIYINELRASYVVVDGYATVEIPDHTWYDNLDGELADSMDVTLSPFVKNSSGRQTPLPQITYSIQIPLSPITLDSPDTLRTTVSTTMSTIRIIVRPGSRVTINGKDYSDTVSSQTGELSYNATVQPEGDNEYKIVVRSPYCRDNSITVVLYRAPQEVPLDLDVATYGTTTSKVMKVTAKTVPGAYVQVTTPHTDLNISELDSTGKFTFNAVFEKIGYNTITIISSVPGKRPSQVDHTVYYVPSPPEYTTKAWPLGEAEYSELLSNISVRAERNQVYVVKGIVQYFITEKPQRVVINTSEDGKSQPVVVENYSSTKWEVGQYYRIYADVYSTYKSMPWLYARYTYPK